MSAKSGEVNPVTMGAYIHPAVDNVSLNFLNEMNGGAWKDGGGGMYAWMVQYGAWKDGGGRGGVGA